MTIYINVRSFPIHQMRFSYSVLYETLISLHTLNDYRRYPLHTHWAIHTLRNLPNEVNRERDYFQMVIATLIFWLWDADNHAGATFDEQLEAFANQPLDAFTVPIVSRLAMEQAPASKTIIDQNFTLENLRENPALYGHAQQWLQVHFPDSEPMLDDLLNDPQSVKDRFVDLLQQYWDAHFQKFWTQYEPHFVTDLEDKGKRLLRYGILNVLKSLSKKMKIDERREEAQYVSKGVREDFDLEDNDTLTLHPSYFTYPMLVFTVRKDMQDNMGLSITYPMNAAYEVSSAPVLAEELTDILTGISDPTRLQILRLVTEVPRSTQELSLLLSMSESAISKHLKLLKQGGWVTPERVSYYVMYRASKQPLSVLNRGLQDILTN